MRKCSDADCTTFLTSIRMCGSMKENNLTTWPAFRFTWEEIAGAVGDYGTLIPIVLGVAIISHLNLGHILLFFSMWYIITGLYYRLPVPVEPMKAIGAIVIAEGLTANEIAASGMILGVLFLGLGVGKRMKYIQEKVPHSVIRGIQLGLALLLMKTSIKYVMKDYFLAIVCILIVVAFFGAKRVHRIPDVSALVILLVGVSVGFLTSGIPPIAIVSLPEIAIPTGQDFIKGCWALALPQAPLTVTNAVLATTLLMKDLFQKDVNPDRLSLTIGLMNLTAVPFGGFPLCHGAGGLAAQYRFGARTGGSNIISGLLLLPIALFFASPEFVALVPLGVFSALLIFAAIELGKNSLKTDSYIVTGVVALLALMVNMTVAFIAGMLFIWLSERIQQINSQ